MCVESCNDVNNTSSCIWFLSERTPREDTSAGESEEVQLYVEVQLVKKQGCRMRRVRVSVHTVM